MKTKTLCPSAVELKQLMLGELPAAETDRFAMHLEMCDDCIEQVRRLDEPDTLASALNELPTTLAEWPSGERLSRLAERVHSLARSHTAATESATLDPAEFDFLAPPEQPDEIGRLGHYRVLRVLGAGGMGVVFLAEDPQLERKVALKVMKPALAASESAKKRFVREARAMAAIDNDHIVHVYQVGEDRGAPFLAMQLLRGETLEDRLERAGRLPVGEAIRVARESAAGLAAADQRGLIHRDIKPANIWIESETGRVKILDFGLARGTDDQSALTQPGAIAGTPAYMAPEQVAGDSVDRRCDLFSLGCVLYRMCTGELPFQGATHLSILVAVMEREPRPPREVNPELPPPLADLITRLLAKRRELRPESAREVIASLVEIERALNHVESVATAAAHERPDSSVPALNRHLGNAAPRSWRNRIVLALAAVVMLAVGVVAVETYRIQTDSGTLVVEINDAGIEAKLKSSGLVIQDPASKRSFTIRAGGSQRERSGNYSLGEKQGLKLTVLDDSGLEIATNEFKLTRGGKVRARVSLDPTPSEPTAAAGARIAANGLTEQETQTLEVVNVLRDKANLARFRPSATLSKAARRHAANMAGKDKLEHELDQKSLLDRVREAGYAFAALGENIAAGQRNPGEAMSVWMQSDGHRGNLLNQSYSEIGIGISTSEDGLMYFDLIFAAPAVRAAESKPPRKTSEAAERRSAEHVIKLAGIVEGESEGTPFVANPTDELPATPFTIRTINLRDLNNVRQGAPLPAGSIEPLAELSSLKWLSLEGGQVTGDDLRQLVDLTTLEYLDISGGRFTDDDLVHLRDLTNLETLILNWNTNITGAGFHHLQSLTRLKTLGLYVTGTTDAGLAQLAELPNLEKLVIHRTQVTGSTLPKFKTWPNWESIFLAGNPPTSRELLGALWTKTNVRELELVVEWTDDNLAFIAGQTKLEAFTLGSNGSAVTDRGVAHLSGLKHMRTLDLDGSQVTDAGLDHLQGMNELDQLGVSGSKVTDAGMAKLLSFKKLRVLGVARTAITNASLAKLRDLPALSELWMQDTAITDDGLRHLHNLPRLGEIGLKGTRVTAAGIDALKASYRRPIYVAYDP